MRFVVDVISKQGCPTRLILDARSDAEARSLALISARKVLAVRRSAVPGRSSATRNGSDRDLLIEQLRDLLAAGMSVIEALSTLELVVSGDRQHAVRRLVGELRSGRTLSAALEADASFPRLLVALVRAAEQTSDLFGALGRYLEHERRARELRERVVSVALYPVLLSIVGSGVFLFLLLYVMPRMARIFEGMTGELPWSAQAMVWWAHVVNDHRMVLGVGLLVVMALVVSALAWPPARARAQLALYRVPAIRRSVRLYHLARWYRTVGVLVDGGIPLLEALGLSTAILPTTLRANSHAVELALREGESPAKAFKRGDMSTPVAEQLLHSAERVSGLGDALQRVAAFHENDTSRRLERFMRLLEPVVMTLIGIGVGVVVVAMYMPIFELASAIQ